MNATRVMTPLALMLVLAMGAPPLSADDGQRARRRPEGGSTWSGAAARSETRGERAGPSRQRAEARGERGVENRGAAPVAAAPAGRDDARRAVPRGEARAEAPRREEARDNGPRSYDGRPTDTRAYDDRRYEAPRNVPQRYESQRYEPQRYEPRRAPNAYAVPRGAAPYAYGPPRHRDYRYDGRSYYSTWYAPRTFVVGRYYPSYRPGWNVRFGLGFSVYAGAPFAFSFGYGYAPVYGYPYAVRAGVAYGGMSFLIDPEDTEVYVDGVFLGYAGQFRGQPVPVTAGYHRVELYAPGFEGVVFDVHVLPGQVIPYRGSLVPAYDR